MARTKNKKKSLWREMKGILLTRSVECSEFSIAIHQSLIELEYFNQHHSVRCMKNDQANIGTDMRKSVERAKVEFNISM